MKSRENYWHWMTANIKFARYDRQFMREVYNRRIAKNRAVTPKQAELWETLVYKYRSQIQQANIDPNEILAASWQIAPRAPRPEHEQYQLMLVDKHLVMRSPYNAAQVESWRNFRSRHDITDEIWDPEAREWIIPITAGNLKHTINFCSRSQQPYVIDNEVLNLIDPVLSISHADQWRVQARLVNDGVMINCANESLLKALPESLPLTLHTLNTLTRAGVAIHDNLCAYFNSDPHATTLTTLNSQQATALSWSQQNHDAIMLYINQHQQDSIVLELIEDGSAYQTLCQEILDRWPNRAKVYQRWKSRNPNREFFSEGYDYQGIDFDQVDIVINKSRNLVTWDLGQLPALIARKNIYYIDPQYDREDYLDGNTTW